MAKWGEGDPRWIVEEREDAKNPNNWHWTEKNAGPWSINRINTLLKDLKFNTDKFEKCEGEAIANNRKGKLIFFYEWNIEAKWTATKTDDTKQKYTGKVLIPNLSEENSSDELDVQVLSDSSDDASNEIKNYLHKHGSTQIKESLGRYVEELRNEYGKDLILPTAKSKPAPTNGGGPINAKAEIAKEVKSLNVSSNSSELVSLDLVEDFMCTSEDLFKVFTEKERIEAFSKAPATINLEKNGSYELWGGNILGKFIEIHDKHPFKLIFTWRRSSWTKNQESKVTFQFESSENGCRLRIRQEDIPVDEVENVKTGWRINYFNAIRVTFGYGHSLMF